LPQQQQSPDSRLQKNFFVYKNLCTFNDYNRLTGEKMNPYQFMHIDLADLDAEDELYRISFDPVSPVLHASMARCGLLQPVLVQQRPDHHYRLVCGFKRYHVARQLGWPSLPALLLTGEGHPPQLFEAALHERLSNGRPLNPLEIATALHKLKNIFAVNQETLVSDFLPLLGLGKNVQLIGFYLPLCELDDSSRLELLGDWLSLDFAFALPGLQAGERRLLLELFKSLHLGKNKQKELWLLLQDVSRMQNTSMDALLQQPSLYAILQDQVLTTTQKTERLKEVLLRLRYPRFSASQQAFQELLKAAHPDPAIRLQNPPYFNSDQYSVAFAFRSSDQFQKLLTDLQRLEAEGVIEKLAHLV